MNNFYDPKNHGEGYKANIRFLPDPKFINATMFKYIINVENLPWYKKMQLEKRRKKLERILKDE
jgi:hypothetical protein